MRESVATVQMRTPDNQEPNSTYHRLGRVWKRSYLLYRSSGMGKSSFVAAMKNFLSCDVYEIDLSSGRNDSPEGDTAAGDEQVGDRVVNRDRGIGSVSP
ncbi:AAA-ATPase At2g46620 [Linum grandiflorum]